MASQALTKDISESQAILQSYAAERDEMFSSAHAVSVGELATTFAHELNQPLGTITNILHGVQARIETGSIQEPEVGKAIDMAIQQTRFAARLINQIRDITDSHQPRFVELDISQVLSRSIELLDFIFITENVHVRLSKPEKKNHMIRGDYTMLQQVVTNLLRNAVEAMRGTDQLRKCIDISMSQGTDFVKIEIKDNGHGISNESSEWLFKPFNSTKPDGMGVGLSICKSLIEQHQGQLWITPNDLTGSTAHLLLPADCNTGKTADGFRTVPDLNDE